MLVKRGTNERVGILLLVVVDIVDIHDDRGVLGDIHAVIHEVVRRIMRGGHPERRVDTFGLQGVLRQLRHGALSRTSLMIARM